MRATSIVTWLFLAVLLCSGCNSFLYGQTGAVMTGYTTEHVAPHLLASDDLALACRLGGAFGTFVNSFERVSDRPNRAALISAVSAGMCAEAASWEAELSYARHLRAGRVGDAKDAQLRGQRYHLLAAKRFKEAFSRAEATFGKIGGKCPEIEPEDGVFMLLGLSSGLMAVLHDRGAGGAAGVSMAIPRQVERGTKCLDSATWWGVPKALAATVWLTVPGSGPEGVDPKKVLVESAAIGAKAGVRLASAMQVLATAGAGDERGLRAAIAEHGKSLAAKKPDPKWRLLDMYGFVLSRQQSDLIWTTATGHRGPTDGLGEMPPEPEAEEPEEDDLLDDDSE
jgi:hypothetical protein